MTGVRRYVLTGAPGAGKTMLAAALRHRGHVVVTEAATDVIAACQGEGHDEPWTAADFTERVVRLQRRRRDTATGAVQIHDRSPLCTLALARYLGHPVGVTLRRELERAVREGVYQHEVFLVEPLGFITPTAVRRISYADAVVFGELHRQVYEEYGYHLVPVPPGPVAERAALVDGRIREGGPSPIA